MPPPLLPLPEGHASRPVLVGLSGGLDSSVLLHLLAADPARRAAGLRAVHVHHGLQAHADAWVRHCARVCEQWGIELCSRRVAVPEDTGLGPEGAARQARHAAFARELRQGEVLALAHHRDDQAETFLLRALRGAGTDGLAAMRVWRPFADGWLWRPLLATPRQALADHARSAGLHWVEDPSNAGTDADRNFLRNQVLPLLRQRWPHATDALARSAGLAADASRLLKADDDRALADVTTSDPRALDVSRLLQLPVARRARVLRHWVERLMLPPLPGAALPQIEAELLAAASDRTPVHAWSGARMMRWRNLLHAQRAQPALQIDFSVDWNGIAPLTLPTGDRLVLETAEPSGAPGLPFPLRVHARRGGERIRLPGRSHSHALKHVLQDLGVAPWIRARLPLLSRAGGGPVMAAGDLVLSQEFAQALRESGVRLRWIRDPAGNAADDALLAVPDDPGMA